MPAARTLAPFEKGGLHHRYDQPASPTGQLTPVPPRPQ